MNGICKTARALVRLSDKRTECYFFGRAVALPEVFCVYDSVVKCYDVYHNHKNELSEKREWSL